MVRTAIAMLIFTACGDSAGEPSLDAGRDATAPDAAVHDAGTSPVRVADVVVAAPGGGDTSPAVDGVRGAGASSGSSDVYSLGYMPDVNDSITLAWSHGTLANGPGEDFAVFENPFEETGGGVFMDLIIVEVSRDGTTWRTFDHRYTSPIPNVYSSNPAYWEGFAGKTPVLLNDDSNPVDPFDRTAAGGDGFDLDRISGSDAESAAIRASGVSFIRLVSASARINPDTGAVYVHDSLANGPDIDGVYGHYVMPAP
jgi:hypothetical protein